MTARTKQNLNAAMVKEALANAKYMRFAACARMNEHPEIARIFQKTADTDRMDHFRKEFDLATLCSDDTANLKTAIRDKGYQVDMYCQFAAQARAEGDLAAAELFDRIRAEVFHELVDFEAALQHIKTQAEQEKECTKAAVQ